MKYSIHCWRSEVVQKMNTESLEAGGRLELVVSSQSLSEVGRLAAHKQVVLIHDFCLGQMSILIEKEQQTW